MNFRELIEQIKTAAADGLSVYDVGQILGTLTRQLVAMAEELQTDGATKKDVVMGWVKSAIAAIVPAIPLPLWLRPFGPIVRSLATRLLLAIADGLVEAAVAHLKGQP